MADTDRVSALDSGGDEGTDLRSSADRVRWSASDGSAGAGLELLRCTNWGRWRSLLTTASWAEGGAGDLGMVTDRGGGGSMGTDAAPPPGRRTVAVAGEPWPADGAGMVSGSVRAVDGVVGELGWEERVVVEEMVVTIEWR